jgi:hypothetical protein
MPIHIKSAVKAVQARWARRTNIQRLFVMLFGVLVVCLVVLYFHRRPDRWEVVSCAVVEHQGGYHQKHYVERLTLRGPTVIEAINPPPYDSDTDEYTKCYEPVGTEFRRDGGRVCTKSLNPTAPDYCLDIVSEAKR